MNKLKPLIVSLIVLGMPGLALADKPLPPPPIGFGFTGVGIGSGQYLGIYLSAPPAQVIPVKPEIDGGSKTPPICNIGVQVLGNDGLPVPGLAPIETQTIQPGSTVFQPITISADPGAGSPTEPQYLNVSVNITTSDTIPTPAKGKKNMGCVGFTGTLGVYDKTSQSLQVLVPMLPAPLK